MAIMVARPQQTMQQAHRASEDLEAPGDVRDRGAPQRWAEALA